MATAKDIQELVKEIKTGLRDVCASLETLNTSIEEVVDENETLGDDFASSTEYHCLGIIKEFQCARVDCEKALLSFKDFTSKLRELQKIKRKAIKSQETNEG